MNFGQWIGFIIFLMALYTLWQIRRLLLLLFAAIILANALNIIVKKFQYWGIKRGYAVLLAISLFLTTLVIFVWRIIPPFITQFPQLVALVSQGIQQLIIWTKEKGSLLDPSLIKSLPDLKQIVQQLQPLINQILGEGLIVFYGSLGLLLSLLLLFALTFMLLAEPQSYRQGLIRLFPAFYRARVDEILDLCDQALQGWLTGVFFNMGIVTIISWVGLLILGIPLPFPQALLAGIFTFIPNLGSVLSMIPPLAIAFLEEPWKPWAVLILYLGIQQLESYILTPRIRTHQVSMLPAITLVSQLFFALFFGFLGLFLSFPLIIVGQIWFQELLIKDIIDRWEQ